VPESKKRAEDAESSRLAPGVQEVLTPIWTARKKILTFTAAVAVLTLIVNFLSPVYYKATTTILPETEKSKLSALGQFAEIAQVSGITIPGSEIARLYPILVTSESILRSVIEKTYGSTQFAEPVNLISYFDVGGSTPAEQMYVALRIMRNLLSVTFDSRTGVVTMNLEMREPQLAADVLNSIVQEMDRFMRQKRITNATEQLKWIDVRLKDVQVELNAAEDTLKSFRERNRKVSDSPQLMLEQERLARRVLLHSTIFVELKKQYELAKIEEIKNIAIVNVLDAATPPVRKERPQRIKNTFIFFFLALVGSASYFALDAMYGAEWRKAFSLFKRKSVS